MGSETAVDEQRVFMSEMLKEKAVRCIRRAQKFKASGRLELAVAQLERCHWCLESALSECYENYSVRFLLVGCLLAQRQFSQAKDEALIIYRSLSDDKRQKMRDPVLHMVIVHASRRLGQAQDAAAFLTEATVMFAEHALPWLALAEVRLEAGRPALGAEAARLALERDQGPWPSNPQMLPRPMKVAERFRTLRCLGACLLEQNLFEEARKHLKDAVVLGEAGDTSAEEVAKVLALLEELRARERPKSVERPLVAELPSTSAPSQISLREGGEVSVFERAAKLVEQAPQRSALISNGLNEALLSPRPTAAAAVSAHPNPQAVAASPPPSPREIAPSVSVSSTPPQSPPRAAFSEYQVVSPSRGVAVAPDFAVAHAAPRAASGDSPTLHPISTSREISVISLASLGSRLAGGAANGSRKLPFGSWEGGALMLPPPVSATMSVAERDTSRAEAQTKRGHSAAIASRVAVTRGVIVGDFDLIADLMPDEDNPHPWLEEKPGLMSPSWITCFSCASSCPAVRIHA